MGLEKAKTTATEPLVSFWWACVEGDALGSRVEMLIVRTRRIKMRNGLDL